MRLRGPLADDPSAKILHYLLAGFGTSLAVELVAAPFWPRKTAAASLIILFGIAVLSSLVLLNRGRFRAASWAYLSGIWLISTVIIVLGGGARSQDTVFYIALSISAAWLVGYRAALVVAGICVGSLLIMAIVDVSGRALPHYFTGEPIPNWVNFVVAMVIAAVPVARILQILKEALAQSQKAEAVLREHESLLENLVQQRTRELVRARDEARAANQAKSAFLANMSHELRTPLNAILGYSALVRADDRLSEQHRQDLDVVGSSGQHLLQLIDDVLDMAKIEAGGSAVENSCFDLHALVHDVVNMMRERAYAKNLELLVDVSSAAPQFVRSDCGKLRQVLTNLIGNAVNYTGQGGVAVRLHANPGDHGKDLALIFEVEDTGIGIALEDRDRIFDPFVQVGKARTGKGTGLGLGISRHFVQLLGGSLSVASEPGRGSRFQVEVPAERAEASEVKVEPASADPVIGLEPGQPDYRILIVEDQQENWMLLERLLQGVGLQVRRAVDGAQAIESFAAWRPHFIFMDLRLPGIGGLEAAGRIREMEGGREVKIVAVTASVFASQRAEVLAAGMDDFLRKPYQPREIFDCLTRLLGVRFVYSPALPAPVQEPAVPLRPGLAMLPEELRKELGDAIVSLKPERIAMAIQCVSEQDAVVGRALARLTDRFAYTAILDALESCESEINGAGA